MMTGNKLMGAVLQLAMQGKIVEQRPEEGTGEELYQKIRIEKERLIKRGAIKKGKKSEEISDDEKPFDIPESWKWVRVEDITILNPKNDLDDNADTSFVPMTLVDDAFSNHHISERRKWGDIKKGFSHFAEGDIGVAKITPCFQNRKSVIFKDLINGYGAGTTELSIVRPLKDYCSPEYLLYIFKSELFINNGVKSFTGTAGQQRIHKDYLRRFVIPLPPLAEQKRIVAKIEELMPFVEQYAAASTKLNTLNATFPEMMKKSILQEAVQGKLVPQDPNDEPASVLLKKIAEEKKRLIKEGKIKKQKPLPEITEDEVPFDIPESWEWVKLGNIVSILGDGIHGTPKYDEFGEFFFVNGNNLSNGKIVIKENTKRVNKSEYEKYKKALDESSILVSINGTIGNIAFYNNEPIMLGKSACYFNLIERKLKPYMFWLIKTDYFMKYAFAKATGTTIKNVSLQAMNNFLVPLPSIGEQERIVARIEELMLYAERLMRRQ